MAAAHSELAAADPVMAELIAEVGEVTIADRKRGTPMSDAFSTLVRAIVGQQLSVKAAYTINGRVLELYGGRPPTPEEVLATDVEALRGCGLSGRKVEYLRSLAEHVIDGSLEIGRLDQLSDEEVTAELVAVRGLGTWTAHMFLMHFLERPDVLPVGDLGIRKAVQARYGLAELPAPDEMERIAEPWRPHRSLACVLLWASLANEPIA